MELTGDKQAALGRRLRVAQSTVNRWLNDESEPSNTQWTKVRRAWLKLKGHELTLDEKLAPYDANTQSVVHRMVDNYLRTLPPPLPRR